jgi:hypothetical protein
MGRPGARPCSSITSASAGTITRATPSSPARTQYVRCTPISAPGIGAPVASSRTAARTMGPANRALPASPVSPTPEAPNRNPGASTIVTSCVSRGWNGTDQKPFSDAQWCVGV